LFDSNGTSHVKIEPIIRKIGNIVCKVEFHNFNVKKDAKDGGRTVWIYRGI
jgi:hypothetical protein